MLLPEHRVLALERLQPLDLTSTPPFHDPPPSPAFEDPLPRFLPPARQHEGIHVQRVSDRLALHPSHPPTFRRRSLGLHTVAMHLLRANRPAHSTPPSVS